MNTKLFLTLVLSTSLHAACGIAPERPPIPTGKPQPVNSEATKRMLMHDSGFVAVNPGWIKPPSTEEASINHDTFMYKGLEFKAKPEELRRVFNRPPADGVMVSLPGMVLVPRIISLPFAWNSTEFKPTPQQMFRLRQLFAVADRIEIRGRTDGYGDPVADKHVAKQRAMSAKRYLIDHGVPGELISINYVAGGDFVGDNASIAGRRKNRRVDIEFIIDDFTKS